MSTASTPTARPTLSLADLESFDTPRGCDPEKVCRCPICQSPERAFHFNTATGVYNCKRASCGATGKLSDFWTERPKLNRTQHARNALSAAFDLKPTNYAPTPINNAQGGTAEHWRELWDASLPLRGTAGADYLASRGIALEVAESTGVRYCLSWAPRAQDNPRDYIAGAAVLFPIYDREGILVAAQGRYILPQANPKTRTGGSKRNGLFATAGALVCETIIITEAPIDSLSLASVGFTAVALCGTSAPAWIHSALAYRRVYLAFDNDQNGAGDNAATALAAALSSCGAPCERLRPEGGKDWNEALQRDPNALRGFLTRAIYPEREFRVLDCFEPARAYAYAAKLFRRGEISEEQRDELQRYALHCA